MITGLGDIIAVIVALLVFVGAASVLFITIVSILGAMGVGVNKGYQSMKGSSIPGYINGFIVKPVTYVIAAPYLACVAIYNRFRPEYDHIETSLLDQPSVKSSNVMNPANNVTQPKMTKPKDKKRTRKTHTSNPYFDDYTVGTDLITSRQNLLSMLHKTYSVGDETVLLGENYEHQLYFIVNTVDVVEQDEEGNIHDDDYFNMIPIEMTYDNTRKDYDIDIPTHDYKDTLTFHNVMYHVKRLPASSIKRVRTLRDDEPLADYRDQLIQGVSIDEEHWGLVPFEWMWKTETDHYTFKKHYYHYCLEHGILTEDEATILYKRLNRMDAQGETVHMLVNHQINALYYVLANMERLYPAPFTKQDIQDLKQEKAVQDFFAGTIDNYDLIETLNNKGYPADAMLGGWLEWSI